MMNKILQIRHATQACRRYVFDVLAQYPLFEWRLQRLPKFATLCQFLIRYMHLDGIVDSIDGDFVAILYKSDVATTLCLRGYVAYYKTVSTTREATIGDHGYLVA